ncbi:MAG TPA: co-chaperone GroES family protein [Candidatus Paceibacterota bacterium]|nr:co-chaperone GroES family protein [Candidatus Paceibacterota bacterium]
MSEAELSAVNSAEDRLEAQLPKPVGYNLLIALPEIEETFASGLYKPESTMRDEHIMTVVGAVIDMGDQAYQDPERFPSGPWCKVGDYVVFRANTGTRITVAGTEYRIMNDDSIQATVVDPRGVARA